MNSPASLRVRISADLADIKQGLGLLRGELAKVKTDAARSMPDTREFENGLRRVRQLVTGLFAGVSAGALFRGIVSETGKAQAELAQLRAVLKSTGEAAGLTEGRLVSMAQKMAQATTFSTGDIVEAQTRLLSYSGIAANEFPRALQLAIDQSVRLGENVLQSAETVGKALEYPAQGVSALTKQGFRFTDAQKAMLKEMERTGRLAEAQALVMDVMEESYAGAARAARETLPGALKALGNAFRDLLDGNGGRGATQLTRAVNDLVKAVGSEGARAAFADLAESILGATAAFAEWVAQDGIRYLQNMAAAVAFLVKNLDTLAVFLGARLLAAGAASLPVLYARVVALRAQIMAAAGAATTLRGALMLLGGPVGIAVGLLSAALFVLWKRTNDAKRAAEEHRQALSDNVDMAKQSREAALEDAKAKRQQALRTLQAARAELELKRVRLREAGSYAQGVRSEGAAAGADMGVFRAGRAVQQAKEAVDTAEQEYRDWARRHVDLAREINDEILDGTADTATATEEATKRIAGSNTLLRDSIARTLAELDRMYADNEIGITDYFQRRQRLQEQAIDAEIAQLGMQLAVTEGLEQRRKLEEDIVKLQRDRAALGAATEREQKQALDELAQGMDEFYIARLENEGRVAAAVRARLEEEYAEQIIRLQREGRTGDVRTIRLHIETEAAKAQLGQFEDYMTQTLARLQATEQSLSAQAEAGMIGFVESESRIRDARTAAIQQLQELRQQAVDFLATLSADSPEAARVLDFLGQLDGEIAVVGSSMDRFRQQVADAAIASVSNLFMDLVEGSKSAGEALRDFVRGFALAMAQIAARALATFLVLQMLDAIYPGLGKATAAMMGAGQYHSGGIVSGSGGIRRNLPAALFGVAPRYHSGGIAGLAPDEVPAILQRGEEVLTRNDPRHRDNAGGGQGGGTIVKQPIVAIGDRAVADALAGAAGEDVVLTHVRNNWGALSSGG